MVSNNNNLILIAALCSIVILGGCAGTRANNGYQKYPVQPSSFDNAAPLDSNQKEQLMIKAQNYTGLIGLYKQHIKNNDSSSTRLKLAQIYHKSGDIDSALFQLNYLKSHYQPNAEVYYLLAQCLHAKNQETEALKAINSGIMLAPDDGRNYNLLGIINANIGDLASAKNAFNKARSLMFSDNVVLNNLAMIDISEKSYKAAVEKLLPLYENGQADEKIRANLLIALARSHQFPLFKEIFKEDKPGQAIHVYQQLNHGTDEDSK